MKRFGKNILAVGTATLLVTAALSFSANAAESTTSHATARFLSGTIGSTNLDSLVKLEGVDAENPDNLGPNQNPLSVTLLNTLQVDVPGGIPVNLGDFLGTDVGTAGAVNQYAAAPETDEAVAASGAIGSDGAILSPGNGEVPSNVDLSIGGDALGLDGVGDLSLTTGALATSATVKDGDITRDYQIGELSLNLDVPLLQGLLSTVSGTVSTGVGDLNDVSLSLDDVCPIVDGTLNVGTDTLLGLLGLDGEDGLLAALGLEDNILFNLLPLDELLDALGLTSGDINVCGSLTGLLAPLNPLLENAIEVNITGLGGIVSGLQNFTQDGIGVNFDTGAISIDLGALLTSQGLDIDNLPANTDLLTYLTSDLIEGKITGIIDSAFTNVVQAITDGLKVEVKLGGTTVLGPLGLDALTAPLQTVVDTLTDALATIGAPIDDALAGLTDALKGVVSLTANAQDDAAGSAGARTVAASDTGTDYSVSALRLSLGGGDLAQIDLASSSVGLAAAPDAADDAADGTDADATDADATDADVAAADDAADDADAADDGAAEADLDSESDADAADDAAAADADAAADANADSAADADVTTTLPSTGASNLTPFWLLGAALILFGGAVLVSEKRRIRQ